MKPPTGSRGCAADLEKDVDGVEVHSALRCRRRQALAEAGVSRHRLRIRERPGRGNGRHFWLHDKQKWLTLAQPGAGPTSKCRKKNPGAIVQLLWAPS